MSRKKHSWLPAAIFWSGVATLGGWIGMGKKNREKVLKGGIFAGEPSLEETDQFPFDTVESEQAALFEPAPTMTGEFASEDEDTLT